MASGGKQQQTILISIALAVVTLVVFWPATRNEFINYDDPDYVTENPHIQSGLKLDVVRWAFTSGYAGNWHPLTWLSHALDISMFGLQPTGHHAVNVILHALNAVLVFLLLRLMSGAVWRSALVAALFALHPLRVESVAWVSERKDVLCAFFGLLTLLAYTRYVACTPHSALRTPRSLPPSIFHPLSSRWYWLALLFFALGLMSKPMLVTWPFVMLLLDYWPLRRNAECGTRSAEGSSTPHPDAPHPTSGHLLPRAEKGISPSEAERANKPDGGWKMALSHWRGLVAEKLPFLALAAASCIVTFIVQKRGGAVSTLETISLADRFTRPVLGYARYLWMTIWPEGLCPFYPFQDASRQPPFWLAAAVLVLLTAACLRFARREKYLATGWFWFLGTLVPVIGIVQVGDQAVADRYTYLPGIGLLVAVVWGAAALATTRVGLRKPLVVTAGLMAGGLAWLAHTQVGYWKNSLTLFTHTLTVTERNYIAHQNVGSVLAAEGKVAEAEPHFAAAAQIRPNFAEAFSNLGLCLAYQGKLDAAIENYQKALAIDPRLEKVHFNLGRAYSLQGKPEPALPAYEQAVKLNPAYHEARSWLAMTLAALNQPDRAAEEFRELLRAQPDDATAHFNYGNLLAAQGKTDEAIQEYEAALARNADDADTHERLGMLRAQRNEVDAALQHFTEAARLKPGALNYYNLGLAQVVKGDRRNAVANYRKALELQPDWPAGLNDLAWQLATAPEDEVRNGTEAVRLAERANALTQEKEARCWGTLDAAYAESGRFADAISAGEKCRELANQAGAADIAEAAEKRLALYREQTPFRQAVN